MTNVLTEARFWMQVMGDAKRTIHCPPDLESRIKGWVTARGMGGLITILPNPACPPDRIFILDMGAIEAATQQALQQRRGIS